MACHRDPDGLSPRAKAAHRLLDGSLRDSLFCAFFAAGFFLFIVVSWDFMGDELGMNRSSFSLGLALKTPLGRNMVVRLELFWIVS